MTFFPPGFFKLTSVLGVVVESQSPRQNDLERQQPPQKEFQKNLKEQNLIPPQQKKEPAKYSLLREVLFQQ